MCPIDMEFLRKQLAGRDEMKEFTSNSSSNTINWYSLPKDTTQVKLRFLPPWKNGKSMGKIVGKHWGLPGNQSLTCVKVTNNVDCPVCKVLEKYKGLDLINDLIANPRSYLNVLVLNDPTQINIKSDRVYVMGASEGMLYWLLEQILDPEIGDITDLHKGHNVLIEREKFEGKFKRSIGLKPAPVAPTEEDIARIESEIVDLDKIWKDPDDNYMKQLSEAAVKLDEVLTKMKNGEKILGNAAPKEDNKVRGEINQEISKASVETKIETKVEKIETKSDVKIEKPTGAPDCFGVSHDANDAKCISCAHEFACERVGK